MKIIVLLARVLFSLIFLISGPGHFLNQNIQYAAAQGVPLPALLVPFSGILALMGALSIMLGYNAKIGAWIIVIFLVPLTLMMHNFWASSDLENEANPAGHVYEKYFLAGRGFTHRLLWCWPRKYRP